MNASQTTTTGIVDLALQDEVEASLSICHAVLVAL